MKAPLQPAKAFDSATVQRASSNPTKIIANNRPNAVAQLKLQSAINSSPQQVAQRQAVAQMKAPNRTGLPDLLKEGIENLSGYSLDDVRVHYNSPKPAELQAHAYTQGSAIYVAPGQEKHLPHEAWHVVQQKQGRVRPTTYVDGIAVNNSAGLEREADIMAGRIGKGMAVLKQHGSVGSARSSSQVAQRVVITGSDGSTTDPRSARGMFAMLSPCEIQNSVIHLNEQERDGRGTHEFGSLPDAVAYDSVNYLSGHYQEEGVAVGGGTYLGNDFQSMGNKLVASGLASGNNLVLLGCESAAYAKNLAQYLKATHDISVSVTGAQGIAFDYKAEDGSIVEAMFNKSLVTASARTQHDTNTKFPISERYENEFINEVKNSVGNSDDLELIKAFMNIFSQINNTHMAQPILAREGVTAEQTVYLKGCLQACKTRMSSSDGGNAADGAIEIDQAQSLHTQAQEVIRDFSIERIAALNKKNTLKLKNIISELVPSELTRCFPHRKSATLKEGDLQSYKKNLLEAAVVFKSAKVESEHNIRNFILKARECTYVPLKELILTTHEKYGRLAANEHIRTMCAGYQTDASAAVIHAGWMTYIIEEDGTVTERKSTTSRNAADGIFLAT